MQNSSGWARRLLAAIGQSVTLTALCFGAPTGLRRLTEHRGSRR